MAGKRPRAAAPAPGQSSLTRWFGAAAQGALPAGAGAGSSSAAGGDAGDKRPRSGGPPALPAAQRHWQPLVPVAEAAQAALFGGDRPARAVLLTWLTGRSFHPQPVFEAQAGVADEAGSQVEVRLERQPDNARDPLAILVRNAAGESVGYVEAVTSRFLAVAWDHGVILGGSLRAYAVRPPDISDKRYSLWVALTFAQPARFYGGDADSAGPAGDGAATGAGMGYSGAAGGAVAAPAPPAPPAVAAPPATLPLGRFHAGVPAVVAVARQTTRPLVPRGSLAAPVATGRRFAGFVAPRPVASSQAADESSQLEAGQAVPTPLPPVPREGAPSRPGAAGGFQSAREALRASSLPPSDSLLSFGVAPRTKSVAPQFAGSSQARPGVGVGVGVGASALPSVEEAARLLRTAVRERCPSEYAPKAAAGKARRRPDVGEQTTLTGGATRAKRPAGEPCAGWASLSCELLERILGSAVMDYRDALVTARQVCRAWRDCVDRPCFMRFQKVYWRSLNDRATGMSEGVLRALAQHEGGAGAGGDCSAAALVRGATLLKLCEAVELLFPWLTPARARSLLAQALGDGRAQDERPAGDSGLLAVQWAAPGLRAAGAGETLLLPLLLGGSRVRAALLDALLPASFLAANLWPSERVVAVVERQERLELLFLVMCALHAWSGACPPHEGEGEGGAVEAWHNVCRDLEHGVLLRAGAAGLVVPAPASGFLGGGARRAPLTAEQLAVVQCRLDGGVAVVQALAGTGKTTTLLHLARARPSQRFLYLVFNASVREEAARIFPGNVKCANVHQLAFARVGRRFARKLRPQLAFSDLSTALPSSDPASQALLLRRPLLLTSGPELLLPRERLLVLGREALQVFFASAATEPTAAHACEAERRLLADREELRDFGDAAEHWRATPANAAAPREPLAGVVLALAHLLWQRMKDLPDDGAPALGAPGLVPMTHDGYLKLFQLSRPDLAKDFDAVLLDEAQDCSPCARDVVMQQKLSRVLVGDGHQSIYGFIGAQNALDVAALYPGERVRTFRLTRSFRFGPQLAQLANGILGAVKGERRLVLGASTAAAAANAADDAAPNTFHHGISMSLATCPALEPRARGAAARLENEDGDAEAEADDDELEPGALLAQAFSRRRKRAGVRHVAVICRTNRAVLLEAFQMVAKHPAATFGIVGGADGCGASDVADLCLLALRRVDEISSDFIRGFGTLDKFREHAARVGGEWGFKLAFLPKPDEQREQRGQRGQRRWRAAREEGEGEERDETAAARDEAYQQQLRDEAHHVLRACRAVLKQAREAWVEESHILTTAHKCKGLEFDLVLLADDFPELVVHSQGRPALVGAEEEVNLQYVAVTRAKRALVLNQSLRELLAIWRDFLLCPTLLALAESEQHRHLRQLGQPERGELACVRCALLGRAPAAAPSTGPGFVVLLRRDACGPHSRDVALCAGCAGLPGLPGCAHGPDY